MGFGSLAQRKDRNLLNLDDVKKFTREAFVRAYNEENVTDWEEAGGYYSFWVKDHDLDAAPVQVSLGLAEEPARDFFLNA